MNALPRDFGMLQNRRKLLNKQQLPKKETKPLPKLPTLTARSMASL